ncbi:hypothetical protein [Streptomyces sp. NPDC018045]|uniref:hypothetical protein n=1 Tax=Streptomyces sp. NPDC018045 TaxID=3365037 RepID=UPI00378CD5C7
MAETDAAVNRSLVPQKFGEADLRVIIDTSQASTTMSALGGRTRRDRRRMLASPEHTTAATSPR